MAHGRFGHGKKIAYLGGLALACATGCQSTDRDDGFGGLDARTKAMLLAPAGGALKAPQQQYAVVDPSATGVTGLTAKGSFNRGMMGTQPSYSQADPNAGAYAVTPPSTTGIVAASATVNAPTTPTTGGTLSLQPKFQVAQATTPSYATGEPPVMPNASVVAPPIVDVIGRLPAEAPVVVQPITPMPAPVLIAPPAMPAPTAVVAAVPQPAADSPKPPAGLTTLHSPVEQPPTGFGIVAPGSIK